MAAIAVPLSEMESTESADAGPSQAELPETSFGTTWIVVCEGVGLVSIPLDPPDAR
jgi:hypothetical protein